MYCIKFENAEDIKGGKQPYYFYGTQPTGWAGQRDTEIHRGFACVATRRERVLADGEWDWRDVKHTWIAKTYEKKSAAKAAITRYYLSDEAVVCEVTPEMEKYADDLLDKYPE